jgi:hypothetical protein
MQRTTKLRIAIASAAAGVVLLVATPARALIGFDDALIYAELVTHTTKFATMIRQSAQALEEARSQTLMWQLAFQNLSNRQYWKTVALRFTNQAIANRYGETAGIGNGLPDSWKTATLPVGQNDYLAGETLGSSVHLADLASVEMTDGVSVDALGAVASYRDGQDQIEASISDLEGKALSDDPDNNTMAAQQNITNGALLVQLRSQQTTNALNAALLQQVTVANSYQRNLVANSLNVYGDQQNSFANRPAQFTGADETLENFDLQ